MSESAFSTIGRRLEREATIVWSRLPWATALAAAVAAGITSLIYLGAREIGDIDQAVVLPSLLGMGPFSLQSVAATAVSATLAAGGLLGVLALITRRPVRNFRFVATALALVSLTMPATIPGPPVQMRLTMAAMHVAVWAVAVSILPSLAVRVQHRVSK